MNVNQIAGAALAAGLLCIPARTPAAQPQNVAELLRQSRAALGGDAIDRLGVVEIEGRVSAAGLTGTLHAWGDAGTERFAESSDTPPIVSSDGYDGKTFWNGDGTGLIWIDGGEAGRAQEIGQAFAANDALWSRDHGGATVVWGGTKSAAGKSYEVLVVTPPGTTVPFELWFDPSTHLPARYVQTIGPDTTSTTYSDYRPLAGVMIPYAWHTEGSDGNSGDVAVTRAAANVPDGAAHLVKPASNARDFSIANGASQTAVPIDLVDNHVYLNVMLDGKGPYRFIFDTGGLNLLDPAVAKEIGAAAAGSAKGGGVGSGTDSVSFANVTSLQIGDATVRDQLFFIAPTRQGFGMTAGQPVDGLIGFEVLSRFVTTFDYANGRVILHLPGAHAPAGAGVLPFVLDGKQPQFACSIATIAAQCTLDTGSRDSISLFAPFLAAHPQLLPASASAVGVNGFGFGGPAMGKLGRIASLGIGAYAIDNVVADFTAQDKGAFAAPFIGGNVGGGILKRFTLTLDYGNSTMALQPNATYATPDAYERAGLFLIERGGACVVLDARPGTPAAQAGILKGDTIATIDGKDVASMSLQAVRAIFNGAPGTALQVGLVAKDGTKRAVTVTLRDFV